MLEYLLEQSVALQNYKFVSFIGVALVGLVVWMQRILANNDEGSRTFKSELTPEADVALSARQRCDQPIQSHLEEKPHVPFGGAKILHPGGVGEFYAMANDRRSVRHFSSRPISIADVEMAILAAGFYSSTITNVFICLLHCIYFQEPVQVEPTPNHGPFV